MFAQVRKSAILVGFLLLAPAAIAQQKPEPPNPRAVMVREATLYLNPDTTSPKLGKVLRGREVAILETSRNFLKVLGAVDKERDITGWIIDKGVVRPTTPNGDIILFGEAADSEAEASRRGGRRGADEDARRLYYRVQEYFPNSPFAGEALWRTADIAWQLEKLEASIRPSYKARDPLLRPKMDDTLMHQVIRKYSNTKWADMAEYALLENKLCGEWQGLPKCPEKESDMYEGYARKHPQSPKAAESLYEAAWRQAALIEIYKTNNDAGRSSAARAHATSLCQSIISQYPQQGDWANRARRLIYWMEQGMPLYGNANE